MPCVLGLLLLNPQAAPAAEAAYDQLLGSVSGHGMDLSPAPAFEAAAVSPGRRAEGIGLSHSGDPFDIPDFPLAEVAALLQQAGGTHYRPHLPLNEAVPELSPQQLESLRKAASDPALLELMTEDLAKNGRWERMDGLVKTFAGAGVKLILVVGAGYRKEAPLYIRLDGTRERVSPDRIGRDAYIALVSWIAGAGVRRYGDRVEFWQVENEINVAKVVAGAGWRVDEGSWGDRAFLEKLISALCKTVHAEGRRLGRSLKTTHNFSTDSQGWQGWVGPDGDLDIVGIDIYANYFNGWPMRKARVTQVVREAVQAAGARPVWVLETGFARAPAVRGFSEDRQAEYFRHTFDAAFSEGASLVLAFGWFWNPRGWFTDSPKPPPWWSRQAGERYWSPVRVVRRPDGSRDVRFGKAWAELKGASRRWLGD